MYISLQNRDKNNLSAILTKPPKASAIVIACHGFTSKKETASVHALAQALKEKGIACIAYDARGHGRSSGALEELTISGQVRDFLDVLEWVKKQFWVRNIGAFGSSMGGQVVLLGAAQTKDLAAIALKAPVSAWKKNWEKLIQGTVAQWKEQGTISWKHNDIVHKDMHYALYEDILAINTLEQAKNISCPTLIIQGTADTSVPLSDSEALAKVIPQCTLHRIPGEDHFLTKTFAKTQKEIADWLEKQLQDSRK